jgi:hypothetical protein
MTPACRPQPGESQPAFAVRFHSSMRRAIPDTDQRNRAMFAAWQEVGDGGQLNRIASQEFPAEKYVRVPCAPVFKEHATREGRDRRPVKYGRDELIALIDSNNHRIADTGNFSPITDGHTPSDEDVEAGRAKRPDVLGYAGPYYLGMIGRKEPRWAIFADEHHRKECFERSKAKRYRSPEVWLESRMEDRFFSPIAALESETPRLELGMVRYGRKPSGALVEKYSAAAFPSAASVVVKSTKYAANSGKEDSTMLSPEDRQELVNAILNSAPMQWVLEQMQGGEPDGDEQATDGFGEFDDDDDATDSYPGQGNGPASPPQDQPQAPPTQPQAAAPQPQPAAPQPTDGMDDDEREEYASLSPDGQAGYMKARKRYMSAGSAEQYSRRGNAEQIARDRALREDYSRVSADNQRLREDLAVATASNKVATRRERYSKLKDAGYIFDIDKELARSAGLDDDAFEIQLETIAEHYQRAPLSSSVPEIPVERSPQLKADSTTDSERENYSKRATEYVLSQRQAGKKITFAEAMAIVNPPKA